MEGLFSLYSLTDSTILETIYTLGEIPSFRNQKQTIFSYEIKIRRKKPQLTWKRQGPQNIALQQFCNFFARARDLSS